MMDKCASFGGAGTEQCNAVLSCMRTTNCASARLVDCYCGTVAAGNCVNPGQANGACKAAIEAGMNSPDPATIIRRLNEPSYPSGAAGALVYCDWMVCRSECMPYCN